MNFQWKRTNAILRWRRTYCYPAYCIRRDARLWSPVVVKDGCDPSASFIPPCDSDGAGAACTARQLRFASLFFPPFLKRTRLAITKLYYICENGMHSECVCFRAKMRSIVHEKCARRLAASSLVSAYRSGCRITVFSSSSLEFSDWGWGNTCRPFCWDNSFLWLMHSGKSNGYQLNNPFLTSEVIRSFILSLIHLHNNGIFLITHYRIFQQ